MLFYALTKDTEENYLADNLSCFISLAPCMIPVQLPASYNAYIRTDWKALQSSLYPIVYGENWDTKGYCDESNNGYWC